MQPPCTTAITGTRPPDADRAAWAAFGQQHGFVIYLQSGGVDTVQPLDGQGVPLSFRLAPWDVELAFRPLDFIQVNAKLNEKMIAHALDLLEPGEDERVLDLFCGLGNFTLPLARDLGPLGIRVCAIAPGTIGTDLMLNARASIVDPLNLALRG